MNCNQMELAVAAIGSLVLGMAIGFVLGRMGRAGRRGFTKKFKEMPPGMVEIYVGNLSYDTTEEYLRKEFEKYGEVASIRIITNRAEAEKAIAALDNAEIHGRRLHVNEARNNKN